ncbi:hypothetical protein H8356DRAFT_1724283 [Neocallimastix lanati (nom. inval.)]|jgi:hypothetical protein|uniref:Uncharacterized protein n=1 Tax=Neocallimastix californiae TaxID=1754190 RepID=A0A1Y2AFB5_9FUNG|nr:hypothetical protein H8356DRAFT_1724283 [Neocallimastix sp. JGI-2020a]ORY21186.1 hypothetical protein LY90DRAFT_144877 [Neocallimastix californiae]|eukprot:ORY21186.1 hypothetical protein LY90DRAFT_144877 [Neocallimastix californiae]
MGNKKGKKEFLDVKDPRTSLDSLRITKEAQKPKIVRMEQSSLLERARLFLPQIAEANSKLANQPRDKINIENIDSNQPGVIKMDLGLGVFDCVDTTSSNDGPIIPNREDLLSNQTMNLNIMLNPSELPDDYTKPLIEMLAESTDSSDTDNDSESDSDSDSDNSDTDSESNTESDSENSNSETMNVENDKKTNKNKDVVMEDVDSEDEEDTKMKN